MEDERVRGGYVKADRLKHLSISCKFITELTVEGLPRIDLGFRFEPRRTIMDKNIVNVKNNIVNKQITEREDVRTSERLTSGVTERKRIGSCIIHGLFNNTYLLTYSLSSFFWCSCHLFILRKYPSFMSK